MLSLFTLAAAAPWWLSATMIVSLNHAEGLQSLTSENRKTDTWYLFWWCVWPAQCMTKVILRSSEGTVWKKKKKKDEGSRRSITPWHPGHSLKSLWQTLISATSSNPWKQTSVMAGLNVLQRFVPALFVDSVSTCVNTNNLQRPQIDKFKHPNILGMRSSRGRQTCCAKAAFRNVCWQLHGLV